jgi:hypothetical protein|tara:strand:- start:72 stop:341 length:270 start_codon:yes stop_codon:yes gene_type:complete
MSYKPPLKITIPIPMKIPVNRGVNATGKRGGNLRVRCTNAEYDMIQEEASKIGLTLAMFCRWSSLKVAQQLEEHRLSNSNSTTVGEDNV